MALSKCCISGFNWDGKPTGKETKLAGLNTYVTGTNKEAAVLYVHDIFGWTFINSRLLADHYANEAGVTVYVPDFFGGEVVTTETMNNPEKQAAFDLGAFLGRNGKDKRGPEIFAAARALKEELEYKKVGAIGFCYGGWATARLAGKGNNLIDAATIAHPGLLEESEIDAISVPFQILAPENDFTYTQELKNYSNKVIPTLGVEYDYQYFPGLEHGFATRGDPKNPIQRKGLERAKNAAVHWFQQHLGV
ncbi:hypothetical protein F66182_6963 [Fusarium sp. NRRL 66182]|nr:hypothetical protein F66182_6963 [Fusarium sp. NRRL 66182]